MLSKNILLLAEAVESKAQLVAEAHFGDTLSRAAVAERPGSPQFTALGQLINLLKQLA